MNQELRLTILQAQNGDSVAMSKLLDDNVRLVWNIVKKFANRSYEQEDLFQIGCEGFIKGIRRFDFSFETNMSTYLVPVIMGEIKRCIRDDGAIKVSRSIKELSYKIYEIKEKWIKAKGVDISVNELAKELEVDVDEIVLALECNIKPESIDNLIGNGEDGNSFVDMLSTNVDEAEQVVDQVVVKSMLSKLNKRDRQIIVLRYYKQKSQIEISKMLGISQVQVSRIEKRILNDMKNESLNLSKI